MQLPDTFTKHKACINAVIETPAKCAAKYSYDEAGGFFKLKKILPAGMFFPFHFGFVPHTKAADGDPLDVMILMDEPAWPGCVVESRIIGILKAREKKDDKLRRNDRLIATALASERYSRIKEFSKLDAALQNEIILFFNTYNALEEKDFEIIATGNSNEALKTIK